MSNDRKLGRLERVDLREVWANEAGEFTPWLGSDANITLLGEAIGKDLEVESQEAEIGPFRADILCKDTVTDEWVLIENQLEKTDHTHLGQLLTYAAGLKAVTIVWIAKHFTEEHRAALDWLNEITAEGFQFFGLEVEAWRIGDSLPAPKFNIVCKPNDWSRQVAEAKRASHGDLTDAKRLQLEFWTSFCGFLTERDVRFRPTKPMPSNWISFSIGRSGFRLTAVASTWSSVLESFAEGEIRAELLIDHAEADACYDYLNGQRRNVESEFGEALVWYRSDGVRQKRIGTRRSADLHDREAWPEYHEWLADRLDRLHAVFHRRVKALDLDAIQNADQVEETT